MRLRSARALVAALLVALAVWAVSTPGVALGQDEAPTVTTRLYPGWNMVGWVGKTAAVADLFAAIPELQQVRGWDTEAQRFRRSTRTSTGYGMNRVTGGQGLWLVIGGEAAVDWERPVSDRYVLLSLEAGLNLVGWTGSDGAPIEEAFRRFGDAVRSAFRWDAETRRFDSYVPGAGAFNTLGVLNRGDAIWVELAREARWWQSETGSTHFTFGEGVSAERQAEVRRALTNVIGFFAESYGIEPPQFTLSTGEGSSSAVTTTFIGTPPASRVILSTLQIANHLVGDELESTLAHEYFHVLQHNFARYPYPPSWMTEGAATYASGIYEGVPTGRRRWQHPAVLATRLRTPVQGAQRSRGRQVVICRISRDLRPGRNGPGLAGRALSTATGSGGEPASRGAAAAGRTGRLRLVPRVTTGYSPLPRVGRKRSQPPSESAPGTSIRSSSAIARNWRTPSSCSPETYRRPRERRSSMRSRGRTGSSRSGWGRRVWPTSCTSQPTRSQGVRPSARSPARDSWGGRMHARSAAPFALIFHVQDCPASLNHRSYFLGYFDVLRSNTQPRSVVGSRSGASDYAAAAYEASTGAASYDAELARRIGTVHQASATLQQIEDHDGWTSAGTDSRALAFVAVDLLTQLAGEQRGSGVFPPPAKGGSRGPDLRGRGKLAGGIRAGLRPGHRRLLPAVHGSTEPGCPNPDPDDPERTPCVAGEDANVRHSRAATPDWRRGAGRGTRTGPDAGHP